jgi:carboxyl-terminal processing protease
MKSGLKKTFAFLLISGLSLGLFSYSDPGDRYFAIVKNLDIFATLFKEVNTYYVDEVNPNELMKVGIDAMLAHLDPYTNYIPEDQIEDFRTLTTGQYGGIGAVIGMRNGVNTVLMPYRGFPAHESGMRIGDVIEKIDGISVAEKSTDDISKLLKGQANTALTLTIRRYGLDEPIQIKMERAHIRIENVPYSGMISKEVGYIKLTDFTPGAGKEVREALKKLKEEGATSLVLDLRDNPGGLLSEAVNVSNVFIPKGAEVVSTKGKIEEWNKTYYALDEPLDTQIPLVVLTSSRSASAAEIVAGVIQDYDRGVLVGNKTFGKGLVQVTRRLTYNSQLKVTTAKYYIPSGRCIQAIDYGHRNEDGSVGKVPDSLKVKFLTKRGRPVYDGGGIDPDIDVERERLAPISVSLLANGLLFDYATEYQHTHPEIVHAQDFEFTDEEYVRFTKWLSTKDYDYTTEVEEKIAELEEVAKEEKTYNNIEEQIKALRLNFAHNKKEDLQAFAGEIKDLLEQEIVSRYYLQDGIMEASFESDPNIKSALEVLNGDEQYASLLDGQK